jgi:phage shock protein A
MVLTRSRGLVARLRNLLSGQLAVWVRERESRSPGAVYEQAIGVRLRQYAELKDAVAGILYLRNKLEAEILERRGEMLRAVADVQRALRRGDESAGLALVAHKQDLGADLERAEGDLGALRDEAESAKQNLLRFREEIRSLEREKGRALAVWAGAQARRRVRAVLEGLSVEADVRALEDLREHLARLSSEGQLDGELALAAGPESGVRARVRAIRDEARTEAARHELEEIKRHVQPALPESARSAVA